MRPVLSALIVPLKTRGCPVRNHKAENGTKAAGHAMSQKSGQAVIATDTVSRELEIPKFFIFALMTQIAVDQAPTRTSIYQHLNSAVASSAWKKVGPNALSWAKGSGKEGPAIANSAKD